MNNKQIEKLTALGEQAKEAASNAYAPYSHFRVGAVVVDENGQAYSGCNVENASYGLTSCAERNAVFSAISQGAKSISQCVIYTPTEDLIPPCGACRQVLSEFMDPNAPVITINVHGERKEWTMDSLLPSAFTPKTLEENR